MPGQQIWGATRPITVRLLGQTAVQAVYPRACRLLSLHVNNGGGVADTVTLFDGAPTTGNDQLEVLLAGGSAFQESLMDVGMPFSSGIAVTETNGTITGYALIAEDDSG